MSRWAPAFALLLGLLVGAQTASAALSKVVLVVEGMT
jgi:hypothetical protein